MPISAMAALLGLVTQVTARYNLGIDGGKLSTLPQGDFYRVLPHGLMVSLFLPAFGFAVLAFGMFAFIGMPLLAQFVKRLQKNHVRRVP